MLMAFSLTHPMAQDITDSPAYRASRRRTAELIADDRRLDFLRTLQRSKAPLSAWEEAFLQGLLARARRRRYHYGFSARERAAVDGLRRMHGGGFNIT
jgi:hypothetical protein